MSVFPLSRAIDRGNLHSTGISRFIAKPVPVPLRSCYLRPSFYVGPSYSGTVRPRASPHARIAPLSLFGSMLSETPGARGPLSCNADSRMACALGQHDRQSPKLTRSRGYVSDSGHTPFTSSTLAAIAAIPGGWIYLTRKGLVCFLRHTFPFR